MSTQPVTPVATDPPAQPTAAEQILSAIDSLPATVSAMVDKAVAKATAGLESTINTHLKTAIDTARERANAPDATAETKDAEIKRLTEVIETERAEAKARERKPERKSQYSLTDVTAILTDVSRTTKPETKNLFTNLKAKHLEKSQAWQFHFGHQAPFDVVMRGAFMPGPTPEAPFTLITVGEHDELIRRAQELNDALVTWHWIKRLQMGIAPQGFEGCPLYPEFRAVMGMVAKQMDTADLSNWIPTGMSSRLLEYYALDKNLVNALEVFVMPRNPFDLPIEQTRVHGYLTAETTDEPDTTTNLVTADDLDDTKRTLALVTLATRQIRSYEVDEDSIVPLASQIVRSAGEGLAYAEEDAIINGQESGTHMDSDVTAATDRRKAWDGLRRMAIANSYTTDIATFTDTTLIGLRKSMQRYGGKPADCVYVTGASGAASILVLKTAGNHPIVTGQPVVGVSVVGSDMVNKLWGSQLVVSEAMREDLGATGTYLATGTKTGVLCFNKRGFVFAYTQAAPVVEADKKIRTRQMEVVSSMRREFEDTYPIASNKTVWFGYNLAS